MARHFHCSSRMIQLSTSSMLLGETLGQLILGTLSDYTGRKPILYYSMMAYSIICLLFFFSHSVYILILIRLLQGFCYGSIPALCKSSLMDLFNKRNISRGYAVLNGSLFFGSLIAPVLSGIIVHTLNWTLIPIILFFYAVFLCILFKFSFKETWSKRYSLTLTTALKQKNAHFHPKTFIKFLPIMICLFLLYTFFIYAPFIFQGQYNISAFHYGLIASIASVSGMVGTYLNFHLLKTYTPQRCFKNRFVFSKLTYPYIYTYQ